MVLVRQLIVLSTYGSQFSYIDRYPEDFARFGPYEYTDASLAPRIGLTILPTIPPTQRPCSDSVASCLRLLVPRAAMVYASDHGEDIVDDTSSFLHASPVAGPIADRRTR